MQRKEVRGVVVYVSTQGEANKRIGLYTEEGMLYFTIYGARSSKGYGKAAIALFSMGRFVFNIGAKDIAKFVDATIYDNGYGLTEDIDIYYAACAGAEIVRVMPDAEHEVQFKLLVDFYLRMLKNRAHWQTCLVIFLWQSLASNGWTPEIDQELLATRARMSADSSLQHDASNTQLYVRYITGKGFVGVSLQESKLYVDIIDFLMVEVLIKTQDMSYKEIFDVYLNSSVQHKQALINVLFGIWNDILGYKLRLSEFMIH